MSPQRTMKMGILPAARIMHKRRREAQSNDCTACKDCP